MTKFEACMVAPAKRGSLHLCSSFTFKWPMLKHGMGGTIEWSGVLHVFAFLNLVPPDYCTERQTMISTTPSNGAL